ncbi:phage minor tail protein L [Dasania sp. GY-MA-18]|uniref:Phage minor tail protein L n=1 Tax=Dasania phycosphaerae TaxID=2950436 RepID=A0A9J6RL26_9GAMM|nr:MULTISPECIES: phage minor tail protein L [Dasania]MCR8922668.1 phage minor tail protein L [Dasania sp. GY-MA-18]MCZ0865098.1 phage minor tail protein L [Dasania phycosphaerae]MCZ0868824.1 phage minor tail protein L [Dasania phycosphaerae]
MSDIIASTSQQPSPGVIVTLFEIDATELGGSLMRFVSGTFNGTAVVFDSNTYLPLPIEASGFQWSGGGSLPTPQLKASNIDSQFVTMLIGLDDLRGAIVRRLRTFAQFLDNGSNPDPTAVFPIEEYRIERKTLQTSTEVNWQLASVLDQEGVKLPRRQVLRETCTHRYRRWVNNVFDYSKATCPYAGTSYFNEQGATTSNPADDKCGQRLSDCRKRFGNTATLPTRAMPGVAKVR